MKRKNSNILIYTTLSPGDKKFKNLVLSAENLGAGKLGDKSTVHHFVLTKNNELIPKSNFANQINQSFKVSSKRVLPMEPDPSMCSNNNGSNIGVPSSVSDTFSTKEDLLFKKARQEPDKSYCKFPLFLLGSFTFANSTLFFASTANSVLLNLLVNGADLPNGYDIMHPYQGKMV